MGKIVLFAFFVFAVGSQAQVGTGEEEIDAFGTSARDFAIVGATTALGALIGASTLSFVDKPKRHLKKVVVGGSIGVIIGVGVVAYLQATKSQQSYEEYSFVPLDVGFDSAVVQPPFFVQHTFSF